MLLDGVILTCNTSIQTNRSCSAIYNIITGTKAIQTVLDIHLYHLQNMYAIYPSLSRKSFDKHVEQLIQTGDLFSIDEHKMQITSKGKTRLQTIKKELPFHYFDGVKYAGVSGPFIKRLLLTIQTFTNIQSQQNQFIPVIDKQEIYNWVKRFFHVHKSDIEGILVGLYDELSRLLNNVPEKEAGLFVDRLTGFNRYGYSFHQLHLKYMLHMDDIPLYLEGITQKFLSEILQDETKYPVLRKFTRDLHRAPFLTATASRTYKLYQKGLHAREIADARGLKINTIYDHLVEIALYDSDFSYQTYVNQTEANTILHAIEQTNSLKLKDIKAIIEPDISYFQIRLVMARMGNSHERT